MKIAVDVMSGDNSADTLIEGALKAACDFGVEIVLVGSAEALDGREDPEKGISVLHSQSVVTMEDDAGAVIKEKQDSSMAMGVALLKEGGADAFVSPGNTGALLTAASIRLRRVKGIRRAAIAAVVPLAKPFVIVDAGANTEVLPENLLQFAHMGSLYAEKVLNVEKPRVALLSNGSEDTKGTPVCREAFGLLKDSSLNFIGNIEARELPFSCCDVVTCDGFTGNIALKAIEGMGKFMSASINGIFRKNPLTMLSSLACMGGIKKLKKQTDTGEYGGAPLLGLAKPVIKAHGNSDAKSIYNAIRQAEAYAKSGIIKELEKRFGRGTANDTDDGKASSAD